MQPGDRVILRPVKGNPEELAVVLSVEETTAVVQVTPWDLEDDGLRDVPLEQIEVVVPREREDGKA